MMEPFKKVLKPGTQIAYIPMHANDDISHHDVQFGFVTSVRGDTVFCRYWSKYSPDELRTKANSEGASVQHILLHTSVSQSQVDNAMEEIERDWIIWDIVDASASTC